MSFGVSACRSMAQTSPCSARASSSVKDMRRFYAKSPTCRFRDEFSRHARSIPLNQARSPAMNRMLVLSPLVFAACVASPTKPQTPQPPALPAYTAFVHGRLAESDMSKAQAQHDQVAAGGEATARDAGDQGHHVLLGTGEPDPSGRDEFLGLDEW